MTKRQLAGMLVAEGVNYAVLTIGFSVLAASLFSVTALRRKESVVEAIRE